MSGAAFTRASAFSGLTRWSSVPQKACPDPGFRAEKGGLGGTGFPASSASAQGRVRGSSKPRVWLADVSCSIVCARPGSCFCSFGPCVDDTASDITGQVQGLTSDIANLNDLIDAETPTAAEEPDAPVPCRRQRQVLKRGSPKLASTAHAMPRTSVIFAGEPLM